MPIYTGSTGVNKAPWSVCKEISIKKFYKILNICKKCVKNMNPSFVNSIEFNFSGENLFIASYDSSKFNIDTYRYTSMIEDLLFRTNEILSKNKSFENYKVDVMGNFTIGKIIIMIKK